MRFLVVKMRDACPRNRGLLALLVASFLLIRLGESLSVLPDLVRSYAADFLCLPLVLSGVLFVHRLRDPALTPKLPFAHGLAALVVFSLYFEGILPRTGQGAVADPVDILMYLAGFLVFHFGLNHGLAAQPNVADTARMKNLPLARNH
jgi:hypothetical protein